MAAKAILILASVLAAIAGLADAATLTYYREYGAFMVTRTDWRAVLNFPQFNGTLGVLLWVRVEMLGEVSGTVWFENFVADHRTVTLGVGAEITLRYPVNSGFGQLGVVRPTTSVNLTASESMLGYDGVTDFAGRSGRVFPNLTGSAFFRSEDTTSFSREIFAFMGTGEAALPAFAMDITLTDNIIGESGMSASQVRAKIGVNVTYYYKPYDGCTSLSVIQRMEDLEFRLQYARRVRSGGICTSEFSFPVEGPNRSGQNSDGPPCPNMTVCSMGGASSLCCPCLEKLLPVLETNESILDWKFLLSAGCRSIFGCNLDRYVQLFIQCGYEARANALLSAVGGASPSPPTASPPPPTTMTPVPPPPPPLPPPDTSTACADADYDLSADLINTIHGDPACQSPGYLHNGTTGCPSATCGVGPLDRPCCPCLQKLMLAFQTSRSASGVLNLQVLADCRSLVVGGCSVRAYLDAMKACTGVNASSSPSLTSGVAALEAIIAGGFLNPRTLAYSERGFGGVPANPALAMGPSHLMTVVRSSFGRAFYRVYIREPWLQVKQSFLTQYHRSNTICRTGPFVGAPNTLYDHLADRWLIMELARNATGGYFLCLILSITNIPYGLLYRGYAIALPSHPGEIAFSIMPDAYYMGTSENPPAVYALDRTRYLAGSAVRPMVRLQVPELKGLTLQGLMPGHLAGSPRAGSSCGVFARPVDDELHSQSPDASADFMEVWELCPSFENATAAKLTRLANLRVSEFDASICGSSADAPCFAQPGSATRLTSYHAGMPSRLVYRSFDDRESLLATFTVDGGNDKGAVMWVELRRTLNASTGALGPWETVQDGTTPSDGKTRWLPSAAMDRSGDIALGYSLVDAGNSIFPSLYYTGRGPAAANGTMPSPETLLVAGTAASASSSFGGRSAMVVDPVDGCGFYFLGPWETTASRSATYLGGVEFARCADSAECLLDTDCDDSQFCTLEKCRDGSCVSEADPLLCKYGEICDEVADVCRAP
eukprot:jgi/Mesvir1/1932/Mv22958-RA.1